MQPDTCFYLHNVASDHTSLDLVLSTNADKYADHWPAKYAMVEQKVVDDESMQWYYNEKTGGIHNGADKSFYLDFDYGWAMIADLTKNPKVSEHFPKKAREWFYEPGTGQLTTNVEGVKTALNLMDQPKNWQSVNITPANTLVGKETGQWKIEYCFTGK